MQEHKLFRIMQAAIIILSVLHLVGYLYAVSQRINYPYDLEWQEGTTVDHVLHLRDGHQLYVEPSLRFTSYVYTPLYVYTGAALSEFMGIGYLPFRIISVFSSIAIVILVFSIITRETQNRFIALFGAAAFIATYKVSGFWFDIARVDMFFVVLILSAMYILRFYQQPSAQVFAAVLATLSFLTKQTVIPSIGALALFALLTMHWKGLWFVLSTLFLVGISIFLLDFFNDGWFTYYAFYIPSQNEIIPEAAPLFFVYLLITVPVLFVAACWYFWRAFRSHRLFSKEVLFYGAFVGSTLIISCSATAHRGGFLNTFIPIFLSLAILGSLVLEKVSQPRAKLVVYFAMLGQLIVLIYSPGSAIPDRSHERANQQLIELLKQTDGDVLFMDRGYILSRVGRGRQTHNLTLWDIVHTDETRKDQFAEELAKNVIAQKYDVIIAVPEMLDTFVDVELLEIYYPNEVQIFDPPGSFVPVTGYDLEPKAFYPPQKFDDVDRDRHDESE